MNSLRSHAMYMRAHIRFMHLHDIINMQRFVMKLLLQCLINSLRTHAMYMRVHIRFMHLHDIINMQRFVMKLCPYFSSALL